jgi:RNA polymerase sigma factor (sigma-70 family)
MIEIADNGSQQGDTIADLALVERACAGDQAAVIMLLEPLHRPLYNLARRMVWHPGDAEDLVQEALLRLLTRLSAYRGEARFATWAYRVSLNAMLNTRRRRMESATVSFGQFGENLEQALAVSPEHVDVDPDQGLLINEVKIGCMTGMLLCLDRPARLAYILGEIFEVESILAASLCDISPAAFRQRLSRARKALHAFVQRKCGQVSTTAACRCERMLAPAISNGRIDPEGLLFATASSKVTSVRRRLVKVVEGLDATTRTVLLFREHPNYPPKTAFKAWLKQLLASDELSEIVGRQ